ncbi:SRPBCC family protein [Sphingomonas sp. G124]|uniref:SRPBCC family protein n=1 Tax=Sphingomonas cremea TaxID=2904799 RepID=A0A9X1QL44_9SPHN|nr:SRPBCC family protein [Sphingomonas cremea]MCF2515686.1 SRPBCC family protein [Sphingomonas cremea]
MTLLTRPDAYGTLIDPTTLKIQRLLPGPIDRIWAYLTESDLRRQWLASGTMEMKVGAPVELVWRNSELTDPPGNPPEGFGDEHRRTEEITELDPPRTLGISWGETGGVTFELEPKGTEVLLTVIHRWLPDRQTLLNVSAGWHAHLDVLAARAAGREPVSFWDSWADLKSDYGKRLPA